MDTPRREFLATIPAAALGAALLPARAEARQAGAGPRRSSEPWPGYPRQNPELVREVVGASHRDETRVRELLDLRPALANACWDWGFGDWETPLGAAAHTGRRSIALLLLERGARVDIFAAAMLGRLDAVRALIAAAPGLQRTRGPHGISLMAHARAGGPQAAPVAEYLATLGDADLPETDLPMSDEERKALEGVYRFGEAEQDTFTIGQTRNQLSILRPGQFARTLRRTGDREFSPSGVPSVTVRFEGDTLHVADGPAVLKASRSR